MCFTIPIYIAVEHLDRLVEIFGSICAGWAHTRIKKGKSFLLLIICPGVAKVTARDGLSKRNVQQYIYDHTKILVRNLYLQALELSYTVYDLKQLDAEWMVSSAYVESDDPDRLVPVFVKPEGIGIVLSGDLGRNQSNGYPTAKKIRLPENWKSLLTQAS